MNKKTLTFVFGAAALLCVLPLSAQGPHGGRHDYHGSDGVRMAADIVGIVRSVIAPRPVVVAPPPAPVYVQPAPVVVAPPPAPVYVEPVAVPVPSYSYGYYNGYYVPVYQSWYWYGNSWCWGGRGPRPPRPPAWYPPHHGGDRRPDYRPAPPPRHDTRKPDYRPTPSPRRDNRGSGRSDRGPGSRR